MSDTTTADIANADTGAETTETQQGKQEQMVSQAEVDRIVRERVTRERAKFSDYAELQAKAGAAQTLEERLASLETELTTTRTQALKTSIAAKFGISTEPGEDGSPSDADLFLTGSDADSLTAQAQRLAGRDADRKKQGNIAPKEGSTTTSGTGDGEARKFASNLFGRAD
jgi:hypothetical protein